MAAEKKDKTFIRKKLQELRLSDMVICLHSSFNSFKAKTDLTPDDLIDVFLENGNTLLVPSFSWSLIVNPPFGLEFQPKNNGYNYCIHDPVADHGRVYRKDMDLIENEMGIIPRILINRKDSIRGNHPLNSFCACGPKAEEIINGQSWDDVYYPLRSLKDVKSRIILAGVSYTRMTYIHYCETEAGRRLFKRWARKEDGTIKMVETGGCSEGFNKLAEILDRQSVKISILESQWIIHEPGKFDNVLINEMMNNPQLTHCEDPYCERCNDAQKGGPESSIS